MAIPDNNLPDISQQTALERIQQAPVIDRIEPRTLALITKQIAPNCTHAEVAHFLELCAHYDLDPFAREAWCAKNKSGDKLLIMVGRDGLRKVAQRNGRHVDGDVVRAKDEYAVDFIDRAADAEPGEWEDNGSASFHRVTHKHRGMGQQRGDVVGAWCRVKDRQTGREVGWFEAPIEEYRPANVSSYSPWSKQIGVMMLAAAERQAIRQATPLSGLLAVGEDEAVRENEQPALSAGDGDGSAPGVELPPEVEAVITRAIALGHAGLSDRATAEMAIGGQHPAHVADWVDRATRELDAIAGELVDAEVVEDLGDGANQPAQDGGEHARATTPTEVPAVPQDPETERQIDRMLAEADELDERARLAYEAGNENEGLEHEQAAAELRNEADAMQTADQDALL